MSVAMTKTTAEVLLFVKGTTFS